MGPEENGPFFNDPATTEIYTKIRPPITGQHAFTEALADPIGFAQQVRRARRTDRDGIQVHGYTMPQHLPLRSRVDRITWRHYPPEKAHLAR